MRRIEKRPKVRIDIEPRHSFLSQVIDLSQEIDLSQVIDLSHA
jgi:hypothetical protein